MVVGDCCSFSGVRVCEGVRVLNVFLRCWMGRIQDLVKSGDPPPPSPKIQPFFFAPAAQ